MDAERTVEMETTWRKSEQGEIFFEHHIPMSARLIGGVMLGFFALFFLYYLVTGLAEYVRVATPGEWLSALPGFLVVLALFLLFGLPTWYILAGRTRVVIDFRHRCIRQVQDLRFYRRTKRFSIDQVLEVRSVPMTIGVSGHRSRTHRIQIDLAGHKPVTVGYEDDAENARGVATSLAEVLRVEAHESTTTRERTT
jgi:hypothetical protein